MNKPQIEQQVTVEEFTARILENTRKSMMEEMVRVFQENRQFLEFFEKFRKDMAGKNPERYPEKQCPLEWENDLNIFRHVMHRQMLAKQLMEAEDPISVLMGLLRGI
jgi:hypothetical protein